MVRVTFDLDVLRSFVTGMDLGSYAKAADRLGRSTSAVSAQLKKLEEQAGTAIFRKAGRGLALTEAGETMLAYARRLLELNDEAAAAVGGVALEGQVRLGVQEDFGERLLPGVLGRFVRAHPKLRIEARIGRNAALLDAVTAGRLDLALLWDDGGGGGSGAVGGERLAEVPARWIGPAEGAPWPGIGDGPVALAAFEPPCLFRTMATAALDRAGIPWRVAFTSPSLAGLWAAAAGGLGVTLRTGFGLPAGVRPVEAGILPAPLPSLGLVLKQAEAKPGPAVGRLAEILRQAVRDAVAPSGEISHEAA